MAQTWQTVWEQRETSREGTVYKASIRSVFSDGEGTLKNQYNLQMYRTPVTRYLHVQWWSNSLIRKHTTHPTRPAPYTPVWQKKYKNKKIKEIPKAQEGGKQRGKEEKPPLSHLEGRPIRQFLDKVKLAGKAGFALRKQCLVFKWHPPVKCTTSPAAETAPCDSSHLLF